MNFVEIRKNKKVIETNFLSECPAPERNWPDGPCGGTRAVRGRDDRGRGGTRAVRGRDEAGRGGTRAVRGRDEAGRGGTWAGRGGGGRASLHASN